MVCDERPESIEKIEPVERTYRTPDGTVAYTVAAPVPSASRPSAAPWLVLLPGLTADRSMFAPQLAYFIERMGRPASPVGGVLAWDAPAHGASRPYPLAFSLDDCADILHGILAENGVAAPVLVGQSFGGYVAQAYLRRYPDTVAGFAAIDSASLDRAYYTAAELWLLRHTRLLYRSMPWKLLVKCGVAGTACTEAGRGNMAEMMAAYAKRAYCDLATHGYRMLADGVRAAGRGGSGDFGCPMLLLCGEHDRAASTKRYMRAWAHRSGLAFRWVPDAGHNANVDNPAFVNEELERFAMWIVGDGASDTAG